MVENGMREGLKNYLSILIALAAVTGALVSWHALRVAGAASSEDGKAIAAALDEAGGEASIASDLFGYQTNTRQFQLRRDNAQAVRDEAMKNLEIPDRWLDEWQGESIRAQARLNQLNKDYLKSEGGRWIFEREKYEQALRSQMAMEKALDPRPFIQRAAEKRRESNMLIALNALFTAAIFFFTAALKTDLRPKTLIAAAGMAAYSAGAALAIWRIFLS